MKPSESVAAGAMTLADALRLSATNPAPGRARLAVALACGFTPMHLQTFLCAQLRRQFPELRIEIATGLYDDLAGTLDAFAAQRFDAVALFLEWADIDPRLGVRRLGGWSPRIAADIGERAAHVFDRYEQLIERVAAASPTVICLPTLPLPPLFFTPVWQSGPDELLLRDRLGRFAAAAARHTRVRVISSQALDTVSPAAERLDVKATWMSGFPYRPAHTAHVAALAARAIRDALPKKGLITDLDNTLWRGIVGDDGPGQVSWDLDHHAQAHGLYQQFLGALAEEGVLVGVASKNDPAVVEEAFRRRDMLLAADRVFPFAVSWGSKAQAVRQVLAAWNVHADSVVFVDDSPIELAEVKAAHPDVECVLFPADDPRGVYELIVRLRDLFGRSALSDEDAIRLESLRQRVDPSSGTVRSEGFSDATLREANAEIVLELRNDPHDARTLELINKTNQFNLNGRRITPREWAEYLQDPRAFVLTATYADRFGTLGKIAVLAGRENGARLDVDVWVMSCRAFARRVEHQCLRTLFEQFGIEAIVLNYRQTPRNTPLTAFLAGLLEDAPAGPTIVTAAAFEAACPPLWHRLVTKDERRHERYANAAR